MWNNALQSVTAGSKRVIASRICAGQGGEEGYGRGETNENSLNYFQRQAQRMVVMLEEKK